VQVAAQREPASPYFFDSHPQIRAQVHPALARPSAQVGNGFTPCKEPKKIRKIHAGTSGECVPSPNSRIDIENLELTIPRILLEFHFHKASQAQRSQQALSRLDHCWRVNRLNISAKLTKVPGELTRAPCHHGC